MLLWLLRGLPAGGEGARRPEFNTCPIVASWIAPASIAVHLVKDVFSQARGPSRQVLLQRLMGVHSPNSSAPPPCTCMLVTAILLTAQRRPRDVDYEAGARLPMAARA